MGYKTVEQHACKQTRPHPIQISYFTGTAHTGTTATFGRGEQAFFLDLQGMT